MHYYHVYYSGTHQIVAAESERDIRAYYLAKRVAPKQLLIVQCASGEKFPSSSVLKI